MASRVHGKQLRKGTDIPFIAHLMAVASLVLEHGGDSDQAIAALLHDAVEDGEGQKTLSEIRGLFGDRVADMVYACSDTDQTPKPSWEERKRHHLEAMPKAPPDALLILVADKVHNLSAMLADEERLGDGFWERFNAPKDRQLWYFREVYSVLSSKMDPNHPLLFRFKSLIDRLAKSA